MPNGSLRTTFTVSVNSGTYAAERITLPTVPLTGVTALIEALPASATVELWFLRAGGNPADDDDYLLSGLDRDSAGASTWPLAGYVGAQIRAKSGGTEGDVVVSVSYDY